MEPVSVIFTVSVRVFFLSYLNTPSHSLKMSEMFDLFLDQGKLHFWSEIIQL